MAAARAKRRLWARVFAQIAAATRAFAVAVFNHVNERALADVAAAAKRRHFSVIKTPRFDGSLCKTVLLLRAMLRLLALTLALVAFAGAKELREHWGTQVSVRRERL